MDSFVEVPARYHIQCPDPQTMLCIPTAVQMALLQGISGRFACRNFVPPFLRMLVVHHVLIQEVLTFVNRINVCVVVYVPRCYWFISVEVHVTKKAEFPTLHDCQIVYSGEACHIVSLDGSV